MKEQIYTIPVNEAFEGDDECPLCQLRRKGEQSTLDLVLGSSSSYMESNIREQTDKMGFCREHFAKMFTYGNSLGNAWILKTYLQKTNQDLHSKIKSFTPGSTPKRILPFGKSNASSDTRSNPIAAWTKQMESSCFICKQLEDTYDRYLDTVFYLYKNDPTFIEKIKNGKGFCLPHFGDLCEKADQVLSKKELGDFYPILFEVMEKNQERLYEDVSWFIEKYDYRNRDADWKNSKDAIQRAMQKQKGGYPADPPYQASK